MNQLIDLPVFTEDEEKFELLEKAYENKIYMPYEQSSGINIPEDRITTVKAGAEFIAYIHESREQSAPEQAKYIRIVFPEDFGTALILARHIPKKLVEVCFLRIRNFLMQYGNREYALRKLMIQLPGKEPSIKDTINKIMVRPLDCYNSFADGGEFSYLFWAHLCVLVKNDIKTRRDLYCYDNAIIQAVFLLEAFNGHYKSIALKQKEKQGAFERLEQCLAKPPYVYTLDQIIKFTSVKGIPLLGQYTTNELADHLKKMAGKSVNNMLPELIIHTGLNNERNFILKNKVPIYCSRLINEARERVKKGLSRHWLWLLKSYKNDPAMEDDGEFEKRLGGFTEQLCPMLSSLLDDPRLPLIYDEMDENNEILPSSRIFARGNRASYSSLFLVKRKDILEDIRLYLPLWYSIPWLMAIITPIKKWRSHKGEPATATKIYNYPAPKNNVNQETINAAKDVELILVPVQHSLDSYMEELKKRWTRLLDKKARENMVEELNLFVLDSLRQTLYTQKHYQITVESITQLALKILYRSPSLYIIGAEDSLRSYIELYLVKLLETIQINFCEKMKRPA